LQREDDWVDLSDAEFQAQEDRFKSFLNSRELKRVKQYAEELKRQLEVKFPGRIGRFDVLIRNFNFVDDEGHRHRLGGDALEVSVVKTEFGPSTVVKDESGNKVSFENREAVIMTDAWHSSPQVNGPRLFVLVTVRFVDESYQGYSDYLNGNDQED
ncbi:MAG: hypothetical protein AAF202_11310, partial [Pseudomonadota bacterium]